jgi:uncharacterized coiled-coil protein SlyX
MPKQRPITARIEELEERLTRLKTMKKIEELQDMIPKQKRRRK